MTRRPETAARLPAALVLVAIAALTLVPGSRSGRVLVAGFFEGEQALADALRNVLLFAPFGAALAWRGLGARRVLLLAALASVAIECLQLAIPGRITNPRDAAANAAGALLGAWLVAHAPRLLAPGPAVAGGVALAAAALFAGAAALPAVLLVPAYPDTQYFASWAPETGAYETYGGSVLEATVGRLDVPRAGPVADGVPLRATLERGAPLRVRVVAGPRPSRFEAILRIHDARELLLLGVERDDLVLWARTRAACLRLAQSDWRWRGALRGTAPGDLLDLEITPRGAGFRLARPGRGDARVRHTVGDASALLLPRLGSTRAAQTARNGAWLAGLALPVGLFFRRRATGWLALLAVGAALALLPAALRLEPTPPGELAAALVGLAAGIALRRAAARPVYSPPARRAR